MFPISCLGQAEDNFASLGVDVLHLRPVDPPGSPKSSP